MNCAYGSLSQKNTECDIVYAIKKYGNTTYFKLDCKDCIEKWKEGMTEDELMEKVDKEFEIFRENFIEKLKNEQTTD